MIQQPAREMGMGHDPALSLGSVLEASGEDLCSGYPTRGICETVSVGVALSFCRFNSGLILGENSEWGHGYLV